MKKVFVFGAKSPINQPVLTVLRHKEIFVFGAESSPNQSTHTTPQTKGASAGVLSTLPSRSIALDHPDRLQTGRCQQQEHQAQTEAARQKGHLRRHTNQSKTQKMVVLPNKRRTAISATKWGNPNQSKNSTPNTSSKEEEAKTGDVDSNYGDISHLITGMAAGLIQFLI